MIAFTIILLLGAITASATLFWRSRSFLRAWITAFGFLYLLMCVWFVLAGGVAGSKWLPIAAISGIPFFSAIVTFIVGVPTWFIRKRYAADDVRSVRRKYPRGQCHACGYNMTGNVSGICPECGTPLPAEDWLLQHQVPWP